MTSERQHVHSDRLDHLLRTHWLSLLLLFALVLLHLWGFGEIAEQRRATTSKRTDSAGSAAEQ